MSEWKLIASCVLACLREIIPPILVRPIEKYPNEITNNFCVSSCPQQSHCLISRYDTLWYAIGFHIVPGKAVLTIVTVLMVAVFGSRAVLQIGIKMSVDWIQVLWMTCSWLLVQTRATRELKKKHLRSESKSPPECAFLSTSASSSGVSPTITYAIFVPGIKFWFLHENPVMHRGKICRGNFPVRDWKAGNHKRSQPAFREILSGINYQKNTGNHGNHYEKLFRN